MHKSSQIFHFNLQSITIGCRKKRKVKPNTAIDLNNRTKEKKNTFITPPATARLRDGTVKRVKR